MNSVFKKAIIKFEMSETGHQIVNAKINGKPLRLILDTAAGSSVLDNACLNDLNIIETLSDENAAGLGTSEHVMGNIEVSEIELAGIVYKNPSFVSLNLDHVQVAGGEEGVHGLLGSPFFSQHKCVIDFENHTLELLKS
ncbi:retropepsin-like aspartic protease [Pseudoalteromonas carrageenovora]|uniref:retropepsin-like aspartic protease n=1 Tax=Pseudoalteromonas carrageenovora TaxID=227 RepID=UPI0026E45A84|nr:retropepsin-like aspartic protease [Pseudoalteromonas carrageenovora]MDO6636113.1 retropepsin-like aspartic protease [Pseudoalteromonas carrageenovora]MDO6646868.1 retropepsin-like aspartic protease [Pseudoalteromonas carrageenovora]